MRLFAVGTVAAVALGFSVLPATAQSQVVTHKRVPVCTPAGAGFVDCLSIRVDTYVDGVLAQTDANGNQTDANGNQVDANDGQAQANGIQPGATPSGYVSYNAAQLRSAYGIKAKGSPSSVIAIVDSNDAPNALANLNAYRAANSLPTLSNCPTERGNKPHFDGQTACFAKVNQRGIVGAYPAPDFGWTLEITLDLAMASAICPQCSILLVEGDSPTYEDLNAAVATAASFRSQGVVAISNSYGGDDVPGAYYPAYNNAAAKGIAVTASSGDWGYGVSAPATFTNVISVGGTSLRLNPTNNSWLSETAWGDSGSGCSNLNAKPVWQSAATQCAGKANADVSAVADPYTGVRVYFDGHWYIFGGTSVGSPIIASIYALTAETSGEGSPAARTWSRFNYSTNMHDIRAGANGLCTPIVWCTAGVGWDGPTGLGTPNGLGAF